MSLDKGDLIRYHPCQVTPPGQAPWTLPLLPDKMVEVEYVESISHETIRQTLKKMI